MFQTRRGTFRSKCERYFNFISKYDRTIFIEFNLNKQKNILYSIQNQSTEFQNNCYFFKCVSSFLSFCFSWIVLLCHLCKKNTIHYHGIIFKCEIYWFFCLIFKKRKKWLFSFYLSKQINKWKMHFKLVITWIEPHYLYAMWLNKSNYRFNFWMFFFCSPLFTFECSNIWFSLCVCLSLFSFAFVEHFLFYFSYDENS